MKLLKQIIEKKLELSQEHILNRNYNRGIWNFYCSYNIAVSFFSFGEKQKIRAFLWKKLLLSDNLNTYVYNKMQKFMKKDMQLIMDTIKKIEQQNAKSSDQYFGGIYKKGRGYVGILSYEMPV